MPDAGPIDGKQGGEESRGKEKQLKDVSQLVMAQHAAPHLFALRTWLRKKQSDHKNDS